VTTSTRIVVVPSPVEHTSAGKGLLTVAVSCAAVLVLQTSVAWQGDRVQFLLVAAINLMLALLAASFFHLRYRALSDPVDRLVGTVFIPIGAHFLLLIAAAPMGLDPGVLAAVGWTSWWLTQALAAIFLIYAFRGQDSSTLRSRLMRTALLVALSTMVALATQWVRAATGSAVPHPGGLGLFTLFLVAGIVPLVEPRAKKRREVWLGSSFLIAATAHLELSWSRALYDQPFMWGHVLLTIALATPLAGAVRENVALLESQNALTAHLKRFRQRMEMLLDTLPSLVFTVDRELALRYVNHRTSTILDLGEPPEAEVGWLERIHPEDRERVREAVPSLIDGSIDRFEATIRIEDGDGGLHWITTQMHPVVDPVDQQAQVEVVASDITDLMLARRTSEARQSRLAFLSNLAQTVAGEVAGERILDRFLEISRDTFSVSALVLLRARAPGGPLRLVAARGEGGDELAARWQERVAEDDPVRLAYHDGFPRFFGAGVSSSAPAGEDERLICLPLMAAGQVLGVLVMATSRLSEFVADDLDLLTQVGILLGGALHLSLLVVELEEQRALALEASRLKSEFLANTSHELRTPLTSILGFLRLVKDGAVVEQEKQQEFLRIAHDSAEKLLNIINDVLDLAKIEAGRLEVYESPTPVRQVVADAEQLFRHQMKSRGVEFVIDDRASDQVLWVDSDRTVQILTNVLGNALKFTPSGGRVTLASRDDGDRVVFTVTDTGIGIPKDELARVFASFYQVDGSTTRQYGGTGLGLTVSRRLAELMGGTLEIDSGGEGRGVEAALSLKVYVPDAAEGLRSHDTVQQQ
jgi:signal transduction histidine kinase/PAS domain-containing protein